MFCVDQGQGWEPPDQIDDYRLKGLIGRGTMGRVYRGHDTALDRPVAIKFLATVDPDDTAYNLFLTEARALGRLQHPNLVTCYKFGKVAGHPYLVSEYVDGQPLDKLPKPIPWEKALDIGLDLARGLEAAHRKNVLHRDIKPANVILSEDGDAKLIDFGLAKLLPPPSDQSAQEAATLGLGAASGANVVGHFGTRSPDEDSSADLLTTHAIVGTPVYMAPEIWRRDKATERSDVYSLGVLLYELCSGHPPHQAPTRRALQQMVLIGKPPRLGDLGIRIHRRFAAIIMRCIHADPMKRFADGEALRTALEPLSTACNDGSSPRRPRFLWATLVVVLLLLAGIIWRLFLPPPLPPTPPQFVVKLPDAPSAPLTPSAIEQKIDISVMDLPPDTMGLSITVQIDGHRHTPEWRSALSLLAPLSVHLPAGSPRQTLKIEIVAYDKNCSIAVGRGAVEWKPGAPRQLTGTFEDCKDCWCAERPPGGNRHLAVWGTSETSVWLVGDNAAIQRYDGLSWIVETQSAHLLTTLWGLDSENVWAVGGCGNIRNPCPYPPGQQSDVILHRENGSWRTEATFGSGLGQLLSVWASSPDNVWAVGSQGPTKETKGIIAHRDQNGWKELPGGPTMGSSLNGVWGSDKDDVWIVGQRARAAEVAEERGMIWHHVDGSDSDWQRMEIPEKGAPTSSLWSVWGTTRTNVWAVGHMGTILHWDGTGWQRDSSLFQSESIAPDLENLWVHSEDAAWAVGGRWTLIRRQQYPQGWSKFMIQPPYCPKSTSFWGVWGGDKGVWVTGCCGIVLHYRPNLLGGGHLPLKRRLMERWRHLLHETKHP